MASLSNKQIVTMDSRGRISFPVSYRGAIGEPLYVSPDVDDRGYLVVRSEQGYNDCMAQIREEGEKLGYRRSEIEDDVRDFAMLTAAITADKNGRITLPQELIEYAGLTSGKAVVTGIGNIAEIWDYERMESYKEKRKAVKARRKRALEDDGGAETF